MSSQASEKLVAAVVEHVPCAHICWPKGGAPDLPWAVYSDEPDGKGADNDNWVVRHHWEVELYEKYVDVELEDALFETLRGVYGYVEPPDTQWIESEGCARTLYRFSELERI